MPKLDGFMTIKRQDPEYRSIDERIKDFNMVEGMLSDEEIIEQSQRCMDCGVPFAICMDVL